MAFSCDVWDRHAWTVLLAHASVRCQAETGADREAGGEMATFVIVHGGWGGGWEWTRVARKLRERSHEVFTPTLTGLGERAHLGSRVALSDHIGDIVAVFRFEELREVVLCGQSYGGMVVTGVADRIPESIRLVAYLDAFWRSAASTRAASGTRASTFHRSRPTSCRQTCGGRTNPDRRCSCRSVMRARRLSASSRS